MKKSMKLLFLVIILLMIFVSGCNSTRDSKTKVLYYTEDNNSLNYSLLKSGKEEVVSFISDIPSKSKESLDGCYIYYLCNNQTDSDSGTLYRVAIDSIVESEEIVPEYISDSVEDFTFDNNGGIYCFKYDINSDMNSVSYYRDGIEKEILSGSWIDCENWYCDAENTVMYVWCDNAWYRAIMSTNPTFQYVCSRDARYSSISTLSGFCPAQSEADYQTLVDNDMMIEIETGDSEGYCNIILYRNGVQNVSLMKVPQGSYGPFGIEIVDNYPQFYIISTVDGQTNISTNEYGYFSAEKEWSLYHYENNQCVECSKSLRFTSDDADKEIIERYNCYVLGDEIISYNDDDDSIISIKADEFGEYKMASIDSDIKELHNQSVYILKTQDGQRFLLYEDLYNNSSDLYVFVDSKCLRIADDALDAVCCVDGQEVVYAWQSSKDYSIKYIYINDLQFDNINDSIKSVVGSNDYLKYYCYCGNNQFLLEDVYGKVYCSDKKNCDLLADGKQASIIYSNGWMD